MAKTKCCNAERIETGFRKVFESQRYKCSKCHKEVEKNFFGFFSLFLILSIFILSSFVLADPTINFVSPTPSNGTYSGRNFILNDTIDTNVSLDSAIYTINNTNISLTKDLMFYCNFDNRSGLNENFTNPVCWSTSNAYNGTVVSPANITYTTSGYSGGAYDFTGNYSYIELKNTNNIRPANYTIIAYIYPKLHQDSVRIISKATGSANGTIMGFGSGVQQDYMRCLSYTGSAFTTVLSRSPLTLNRWYQIACVGDGTNMYLYINGVLNNQTAAVSPVYGNDNYTIGASNVVTSPYNFFNGSIDEVKVYNRTLTASEISFDYSSFFKRTNLTNYNSIVNTSIYGVANNIFTLFANDTNNAIDIESRTLRFLMNLNFSAVLNSIVSPYQYGANTHFLWLTNGTAVDTNDDGILNALANITFHKEKWLAAGVDKERFDADFNTCYKNQTVRTDGINFTCDFTNQTEHMRWMYENNQSLTLILDYMPTWLADNSSGNCNSLLYCPPSNYTIWNSIVLDYVNRLTLNGTYISVIKEFEVWNEPWSDTFLMKLGSDSLLKVQYYTTLYNNTRNTLEAVYPTIPICSQTGQLGTPNIRDGFFSNFSNQRIDCISTHRAGTANFFITSNNTLTNYKMSDYMIYLKNKSNFYNVSVDNWIITETGLGGNSSIQNTSANSQIYMAQMAYSMADLMAYNSTIPITFYQWSERYKYSYSGYPEKPSLFSLLSEPQLDNTYYAPYMAVANFTRYAAPNSNQYNCSSSYGNVLGLCTTITSVQNLIVVNSEVEQQNITLNCGSFTGNLIDTQNGNLFSCASGSVNLGVIDAYDVRYYTEPVTTHPTYYNYLLEDLGFSNPYYQGSNDQLEDTNMGMCDDLSSGVSSFAGYIPTVFIVLGVVVVMGAIVLLIFIIKNVEKNGISSFSMSEIPTEYVVGATIGLGILVFVMFAALFATSIICSINF